MNTLTGILYAVIDTETTGLDPKTDRIVEIACVVTDTVRVHGMYATLVHPEIDIPPQASAIHGITNADVIGAPKIDLARYHLKAFISGMRADVLVAHNAEFDAAFLGLDPPEQWLCTKRLAAHLYPDAPEHRNQTLRYWLPGITPVETFGIAPHRALGDALVTAHNLRYMLKHTPLTVAVTREDLLAFANAPILYTTMPLGKHRGPISAIPEDYLVWALGPTGMREMSADLRYSLQHELDARRSGERLPL